MKNLVQKGDTLTLTAPRALSSGDGCLIGTALFGVAISDIANAAEGEFSMSGVFDLPKEAPLVISAGDLVYWDDAAEELDKTNTNLLVGICVADAASAATTVRVKLNQC